MKRRLAVPVFGALASALLITAVGRAAAAPIDLPAALANMGTATAATVVLVPPMAVFRAGLDQAGLLRQGCHYAAADRAAVRSLAALMQSVPITVNPVYQRPDLREGVYFTMADGSSFHVLIGDNAGGKLPVLGFAETTFGGQSQSASMSAGPTLSTALRDWAKGRSGTSTGSACGLQVAVAVDPKAPPPVPGGVPGSAPAPAMTSPPGSR